MSKKTFLYLCLFLFFLNAEKSSCQEVQRITIQFKNQNLDSALYQLKKKSECYFYYPDKIITKSNKISRNFKNKTISQVLDVLLENSNYTYVINDNRWVLIYEKCVDSLKIDKNRESIPLSITGKVLDEEGKFTHGASICLISEHDKYISKDKFIYITDNGGNFTISTTTPNVYILLLYLGHIPKVVHINQAELIKLEPDEEILNEILHI